MERALRSGSMMNPPMHSSVINTAFLVKKPPEFTNLCSRPSWAQEGEPKSSKSAGPPSKATFCEKRPNAIEQNYQTRLVVLKISA